MQLHRFHDIQAFCDRAQPYLRQHTTEHNLLLGILHNLMTTPERYPKAPYLVTVEQEDQILAVALQTPPYKLVLSKVQTPAALVLIAEDTELRARQIPGFSGLVSEAQTFEAAWHTLTGKVAQLSMQMRIHELVSVQPLPLPPGWLRLATLDDRSLLLDWFQGFIDEAIANFGAESETLVDHYLNQQSLYVWEDKVPVSFACTNPAPPFAARVGPVYTPKEYRRQGYATACVSTLTQTLLEQGCDRCFIFTDWANPTSNHIYQAIGYRPVCDWYDYAL
jgi:uncharacterized protein